jgi:predicted dehydrogenase
MKYKTALIGCGRISFKHIEAFAKNEDKIFLAAVCNSILSLAEEKKKEYQNCMPGTEVMVYADYKNMLVECRPDIVTIATETGKHKEIALDCLNGGSHVICKKPMALSLKDADAMNEAAKKR